jgi:hypothetical protein
LDAVDEAVAGVFEVKAGAVEAQFLLDDVESGRLDQVAAGGREDEAVDLPGPDRLHDRAGSQRRQVRHVLVAAGKAPFLYPEVAVDAAGRQEGAVAVDPLLQLPARHHGLGQVAVQVADLNAHGRWR